MNDKQATGTVSDAKKILIRLEGLTKVFPRQREPAVRDLTLEIPEGEIVILVGPSGCGKTTTLKMINRIIEPTSGRILLDDEDVTNVNPDELRRRMGYVIQQIGLFPHQTVAANVMTVPVLTGASRAEARAPLRNDLLHQLVRQRFALLEANVFEQLRHPFEAAAHIRHRTILLLEDGKQLQHRASRREEAGR